MVGPSVNFARAHRLAHRGTPGDVAEVAEEVVGLHASDPASVFLALRARIRGLEPHMVEQALYDDRSIARVLGMRRTMFVVPRHLIPLLDSAVVAALAPAEERRLVGYVEQAGIARDGLTWVRRVKEATLAALADIGPARAVELTELVPDLGRKLVFGEGKKWGAHVGVSTRILFLLAAEGAIIRGRPRGRWISSQYEWVLRDHWLGPLPPIGVEEARRELARRWHRAYGGRRSDLQWWTGWGKRVTEAAAEIAGLPTDEGDPVPADGQWAAMLPGLDPLPMGWKDREWFLQGLTGELFDRNGNIGPTIWVNGRIVGGWAQRSDGSIAIEILRPVTKDERDLIEVDMVDLARFLDGIVVTPRFRTPLEKQLTT